jgi:hypothetical protein
MDDCSVCVLLQCSTEYRTVKNLSHVEQFRGKSLDDGNEDREYYLLSKIDILFLKIIFTDSLPLILIDRPFYFNSRPRFSFQLCISLLHRVKKRKKRKQADNKSLQSSSIRLREHQTAKEFELITKILIR